MTARDHLCDWCQNLLPQTQEDRTVLPSGDTICRRCDEHTEVIVCEDSYSVGLDGPDYLGDEA